MFAYIGVFLSIMQQNSNFIRIIHPLKNSL